MGLFQYGDWTKDIKSATARAARAWRISDSSTCRQPDQEGTYLDGVHDCPNQRAVLVRHGLEGQQGGSDRSADLRVVTVLGHGIVPQRRVHLRLFLLYPSDRFDAGFGHQLDQRVKVGRQCRLGGRDGKVLPL